MWNKHLVLVACLLLFGCISGKTQNDTIKLDKEKVFHDRPSNLFEETGIGKRIQIQNIYYDYNQWDIRPDAAERLDNVVILLKDNPGISVELGSHTDSRGNDDYNQKLSYRRAAAAVAYIVRAGVDSARITAQGYGESQLVNRCRNGVECTEGEHRQNRRTELHITGISENTSWKSLPQIMDKEQLEQENKAKSPPQKRFQEANTSIPLPTLKPDGEAMSAVRILPLPPTFKGCAIELARSEVELPANHMAFQGQKEVFRLLENDGKFTYLIANLGTRDAATTFFRNKVKPVNKTAKLVLYTEGGKEYLSE
ncbi:MAG: OmpA family protein [Saprospiraceae bacterium]|nr:OmpA family protein [Saprospiraceae bacterium]